MAGLQDVARKAGVSLSTASVVLNPGRKAKFVAEDRVARVRDAARELGYVVNYHARSMKMGLSRTVGIPLQIGGQVWQERSRLGNAYFSSLVGAAEITLTERGFATTIIGPRGHEDSVLDRARRAIDQRRIDGLVIPGVLMAVAGHALLSRLDDTPVVAVEYREPTDVPVVDWDERLGLQLIVDHLADLGHRRLLWLGRERHPASGPGVEMREALFCKTCMARNISPVVCGYSRWGGATADARQVSDVERESDQAAASLAAWLSQTGGEGVTAIVGFNDAAAIGACRALVAAQRRVPQEFSVVGIDNQHAALMVPKLTSLDHMLHEMGHRSAEILLDMIENKTQLDRFRGLRELVPPVLSIRESTGPASEGRA